MHFLKPAIALSALWVLAACGGSGGTGMVNSGPNPFETAEYQSQGGLDLINASAMYLLGGTGAGVSVAVFDTGGTFSHPDLAGAYAANNYFLPAYSSPVDGEGHGTLVAGIIAARKNNTGMHGVAYNANIVSYKILDDTGSASGLTDATWAAAINTMANTNVLITNNSYGTSTPITSVTAANVSASMPLALAAYNAYSALGGVQVWAAGNGSNAQPNIEPGLPYLFPGLQSSWIAVMAVDPFGNEPGYTNRCGVAAAWCIAAPGGGGNPATGGIYSTFNDGTYAFASGTSFAAPHVSGAIAALKSVFPNLTFQQIRNRILATANKTGIYANSAIFGQGLLDLDAASRPVGGASLALSGTAGGAMAALSGARINLPAGALAGFAGSQGIMVLDNYQRAPFMVPLESLSTARRSYLSLADLGLDNSRIDVARRDDGLSLAMAESGYTVGAMSGKSYVAGFGQGSRVLKGFARLSGMLMPQSQFRMREDATGAALGMRTGGGMLYASVASGSGDVSDMTAGTGIASWSPGTVVALNYVTDNARNAFGLTIANDLQKPMGWSGTGAFGASGDAINLGYTRNIPLSEQFTLGLSGQLSYVTADPGALVYLDDAVVASADLGMSYRLSGNTTLTASFGIEQPLMTGDGYIRAASGIDSNGRISYRNVAINQPDLLSFGKAMLGVKHQVSDNLSFSAGGAFVRDGFGTTDAIIGVGGAMRF